MRQFHTFDLGEPFMPFGSQENFFPPSVKDVYFRSLNVPIGVVTVVYGVFACFCRIMNRRGYGDLALEAPTARVTLFGFDEEGKMYRHGCGGGGGGGRGGVSPMYQSRNG